MEAREIEWEVTDDRPACKIVVDNEKIVLIIGSDEMIAAKPMTNTGESVASFIDRFLNAITFEEE